TADRRVFAAEAVVVTVPLGVLQARPDSPGSIRFVPDLAEKRESWQTLAMGPVVKLAVRFREPFWAKSTGTDMGFLHLFAGPMGVWWSTAAVVPSVLVGWSGGPSAAALAGTEPLAVMRRALDQLGQSFPNAGDLSRNVADWRLFDWQRDRW